MNRKAICPVPGCGKVFEVFLRNQACCCKEHQKEWAKIVKQRWHAIHRILPDDLDWANGRLEAAISEIMANAAALNNTRFELKQVKADNQCLFRQGEDMEALELELEWVNCRLENVLYHWSAHVAAAEKITCEMLDLREKLASAEDKIRELENGQNKEIARLEKELAARDDTHVGKMLAVARVELEEERGKARIIRLELETARDEIRTLTRERDEAREQANKLKAGKAVNLRQCKRLRLTAMNLPCGKRSECFRPHACGLVPAGCTLEKALKLEAELNQQMAHPKPEKSVEAPETVYTPMNAING